MSVNRCAPSIRDGVEQGQAYPAAAPMLVDVDLPVHQPFDAPGLFQFLAARAVQGVEVADLSDSRRLRYARTLPLPRGLGAVDVVATYDPGTGWRLQMHLELASLDDVAPAVARVRHLLNLDADPLAIDDALRADPVLATVVSRRPGVRVPGAGDPDELVFRALIGQQISVVAARTHLNRLAGRAGSGYTSTIAGLDRVFPTPAQIAETVPVPNAHGPLDPDRPLRLPRQTIRAVREVALALTTGDLIVDAGADAANLRSRLLARPGIGPWTAAYIAMRVLGDPDVWLPGDVALLAGARAIGLLESRESKAASHRRLTEQAAAWAPWQSYAVMHLWRAASAATDDRT